MFKWNDYREKEKELARYESLYSNKLLTLCGKKNEIYAVILIDTTDRGHFL